MNSTNRVCEKRGERCPDDGWHEYCGYCAAHWLELDDEDRNILLEQQVSSPKIENHNHTHEKTVYMPQRNRKLDFLVVFLSVATGVFVGGLAVAKFFHIL